MARPFEIVGTQLVALAIAGVPACFVSIDENKLVRPSDASTVRDGADTSEGGPIGSEAEAGVGPDLLGHWTFDEADGTTALDSSGRGNDGTLTGAPVRVAGVFGKALDMKGSQSLDVAALDGANFPWREGTLSLWFLTNAQGVMSLLDRDTDADATRAHLYMGLTANVAFGIFDFECWNAGGTRACDASAYNVQHDRWRQVVVTWTTTLVVVYLGDVSNVPQQVATGTATAPIAPTDQRFKIGATFRGQIDDVRLYKRALGSGELAQLR